MMYFSKLWNELPNLLVPSDVFHFSLLAIFSIILGELILMLVSRFRRMMFERARQKLRLALLRAKVDMAMVPLVKSEKKGYSWHGYRKFRVIKRVSECREICSFYLAPHDGKPLPSFKPGQFLTIRLRLSEMSTQNDKEAVRCYSLSDSPGGAGTYRVTIKRVSSPLGRADLPPGLVSNYFHDHIEKGDVLDVMAPSGNFTLDMSQNVPVVLIATGIGVTPILCMLNAMVESGLKREVWLFLGFRCRNEHPFQDHIQDIVEKNPHIRLNVCYSNPEPEDVPGRDYDYRGRIGSDLIKRLLPSSNYGFYLCGSGEMVSQISRALQEWGVPESDIKFESFGPATSENSSLVQSVPEKRRPRVCPLRYTKGNLIMTPFKTLGAVKWSLVWSKESGGPPGNGANGVSSPREKFMGWMLVSQQQGWRAVAGFNPAGRFRGGSLHPAERSTSHLRMLLSRLAGMTPEEAAKLLQHHLQKNSKMAQALDLPVWLDLIRSFPAVKVDSEPYRSMPTRALNEKRNEGEQVTVTFTKSKKILKWDSSSGSLLEFALRNGVTIDAGCRSGNCGACITAMMNGGVTYLQAPGMEPRKGACLTCISVPRENLTLHA